MWRIVYSQLGSSSLAYYILFVVLLGTTGPEHGYAQAPLSPPTSFASRHWTTADGLPINDVYDIAQTTDGYLWLATRSGLVRFDGLTFKVFTVRDHPNLLTNHVRRLFADSAGRLWIMTFQADLVLLENDTFTPLDKAQGLPGFLTSPLIYTRPVSEHEGTVWVTHHDGISWYEDGILKPFFPDQLAQPIDAHFFDDQDNHWLSEIGGVVWRYHPETGLEQITEAFELLRLREQKTGKPDESIANARIWQFMQDSSGKLWLSTEGGFYIYDAGRFDYPLPLNDQIGIARRFVHEDAKNQFWFDDLHQAGHIMFNDSFWWVRDPEAPVIGRPFALETEDFRWTHQDSLVYYENRKVLNLGQGARPNAFLEDQEGSIWISALSGLFQLRPTPITVWKRPRRSQYGTYITNAYPIAQNKDGTVWVGTLEDDLLRISGTKVDVLDGPNDGFYLGHPWALYLTPGGTFLAGGYGTCEIEYPKCFSGDSPPGERGEVRVIYEDTKGNLWAGGESQVVRRPPNGSWHFFTAEQGYTPAWTQALHETANGDIWIGTQGKGLWRYRNDTFEQWGTDTGYCSDDVLAFHEDRENQYLWVATGDQGICRVNLATTSGTLQSASVIPVSSDEGLFHNTIHNIQEDDFGRFWMSTPQGIFWVDKNALYATADGSEAQVVSVLYDERDGMLSQTTNTNMQPSGMKDAQGRLWFPTQNGVVMLDPATVQPHAFLPPTVIESVLVGDSLIMDLSDLKLTPGQRELEITYTALSYVKSEDIQFQYRLSGLDDTWRANGSDRKIRFTNLDPGTYTFQIKAANSSGVWNTTSSDLTFVRQPYFFETSLFSGLAGVSILLGMLGFLRYRTHRVQQHNIELEQKVEERTAALAKALSTVEQQAEALQSLDETKSRFFANVSHEFRTPLTLIRGHLYDVTHKRFGSSLANQAASVLNQALDQTDRLRHLVEQLLALARLQSQQIVLHAQRIDLNVFVERQVSFFESLAEKHHIDLSFTAAPETVSLYLDPDHIEKVITNLISNALKFTPDGGRVTVTLLLTDPHQSEDRFASLSVSDSGIGIREADLSRVFERFYQVDSSATRRYEGTGVGLALAKELVELHGGSITVSSQLDQGSTFTICLPLGRNHLEDDEIVHFEQPIAQATNHEPDLLVDMGEEGVLIAKHSTNGIEREHLDATVLVVEDNPDLRAYLAGHLQDLYHVLEAPDGQAALTILEQHAIDLILSDVMMPRLDGMSLLRAVKEHEHWQTIPIMLLTARADQQDRLRGLEAQADDYLAKPFNLTELLVRVRNLVLLRKRMHIQFSQKVIAVEAEALELPNEDVIFLERVQQAVRDRLSDEAFDVVQLATAVYVSRVTLFRRMKALTGLTPVTYMRKLRMEHARQMLEQGHVKTVAEVAAAVGFKDPSYFTRLYRKTYGHPPSTLLTAPEPPS